jgi:hypothetical protein
LFRPRHIGYLPVEEFVLGKLKIRGKLIGRKIVIFYTPDNYGKTIGQILNISFSDDI